MQLIFMLDLETSELAKFNYLWIKTRLSVDSFEFFCVEHHAVCGCFLSFQSFYLSFIFLALLHD